MSNTGAKIPLGKLAKVQVGKGGQKSPKLLKTISQFISERYGHTETPERKRFEKE